MCASPSTIRDRFRDYWVDKGYAVGWTVVKALPDSFATALFNVGADIAARGKAGEQLRKNLARVTAAESPQAVSDAMVRNAMRSYARYWKEAFRLSRMDLSRIAAEMSRTATGKEHLEKALADGKGLIIAMPHSGNWDMAGLWLARNYGSFTTVAERLKPESLYQRFVSFREGLGMRVIPHVGSEKPPMQVLSDVLLEGGIVGLLGERDLRARGIEVTFFGETTRMPAGPARLAIDTGATLCVAHCWFEGNSWRMAMSPPIDVSGGVAATTQRLATVFEHNIAHHPEDWHVLQPLWLCDLSESHRAHIEQGGGDKNTCASE